MVLLLVAAVKAVDFYAIEVTTCQDIPNITIAANQSYDMLF
jgi:hypothetical protein